jgi:uncharacterized protein (DUF305 family)
MSRILIFAVAVVLGTPGSPQQAQAAKSTAMMALDGAAFDREFVAQMIKDHEQALEERHNGPL